VCPPSHHHHDDHHDVAPRAGYPPTVNAYPEAVAALQAAAAKIVGTERASLPMKTLGAEDFSYFLQARPGAFWFVGGALPGELRPHHKSVFDIDEDCMLVGASVFVQLVADLLGPGGSMLPVGAAAK
jgi:amidohydrolase